MLNCGGHADPTLKHKKPKKIQLPVEDGHLTRKFHSLTILGLPPGLLAVWFEGGDDILDAVTDGVGIRIIRSP